MNDANDLCGTLGPDVTALARGELTPAEEAPVRAHLAACPACAALAADVAALSSLAAARPSPAFSAAGSARFAAALDAAWEAEDARIRSRGPVARLLHGAGARYAESRTVRFLTTSVALHAAAAVLLCVYLGVLPGMRGPEAPGVIDVARDDTVPLDYEDPLVGSMPTGRGVTVHPGEDVLPPGAPRLFGEYRPGGLPLAPPDESPDLGSSHSMFPNREFAAFASPRLHGSLRAERMARAYGAAEGARAALSVDQGLAWLSGMQEADGTWPSGRRGATKAESDRFRGGATGIAVLAYLGDGWRAVGSSAYSGVVRAGVEALARTQDPKTGLLGSFAKGPADDRPMCNHGPALAALAEAYGLDYGRLSEADRAEYARKLAKAVAATLRAQRPDGSFGYTPDARQGDSSVTLLQVEGLEAARRAGIAVDPAALRKAGAWLAARVGPDGRLGYREAGDRAGDATLAAEALPHAATLGLPGKVRDGLAAAVLDDCRGLGDDLRGPGLGNRVLFRSALLEAVAADPAGLPVGERAARSAMELQGRGGAFSPSGDRYAQAAGEVLTTARSVRALTAPYRAP